MGTLGPAKAALLIVVSQIIVAYAVELFGLFGVEKVGFEWKKLIGAVVAIIGIMHFFSFQFIVSAKSILRNNHVFLRLLYKHQ